MAKWPVDKTPTLSDVLFSIPLRQNQNNKNCCKQKQNNISISIPDRRIYRKRSWEKNQNEITVHASTLGRALASGKQS